jgi:hypothetical protein
MTTVDDRDLGYCLERGRARASRPRGTGSRRLGPDPDTARLVPA